MKNIAKGVIALGALLASSAGLAATASSTINPTVTIITACTIDTTGVATALGEVEQNAGTVSYPGEVNITCTNGMDYGLGFGPGQNYGVGLPRLADSSGNFIYYYLSSEAGLIGEVGLNTIDGNYTEVNESNYLPLTGTGSAQLVPVNTSVMVSTQPTGIYSDTNTIVVVWP